MNQITVTGNLTSDLELRYMPNGTAKAAGTVADSRSWKNKSTDSWEEETTFHRIVIWGPEAENAVNSVSKGVRVMVSGRYEQRDWEDKEGNKRTTMEIKVDEFAVSTKYATVDQITKVRRGSGEASTAPAAAPEPVDVGAEPF